MSEAAARVVSYPEEFTVFRELLQNADDAGAKSFAIEFQTLHHADATASSGTKSDLDSVKICKWLVKNNGALFEENDWSCLMKIAEGNPDGRYSLSVKKEECKRDNWTVIEINLKRESPIPRTFELTRFLVICMTFLVNIQHITISLDNGVLSTVTKSRCKPDQSIAIPEHMIRTSPESTMSINAIELIFQEVKVEFIENPQVGTPKIPIARVDLEEQIYIGAAPEAPSLKPSTNSSVKCCIYSADVTISATPALEKGLESATNKKPLKDVSFQMAFFSKEEHDKETQDNNSGFGGVFHGLQGPCPLSQREHAARIFIGQSTAQTTGMACHMSGSFISTMEHGLIDLADGHVAKWNEELLYIGGFLARMAYDSEMNKLHNAWSTLEKTGAAKELALHTMKSFTFHPSTPDSKVSNIIKDAFFLCSKSIDFLMLSDQGIRHTKEIRHYDADFAPFMRRIPALPVALRAEIAPMVRVLPEELRVRPYGFQDIINELKSRCLTELEMAACLRWWTNTFGSQGALNEKHQNLRNELLKAGKAVSGGKEIKLSVIQTFIDGRMLGILNPDDPLPEDTIPPALIQGLVDPFRIQDALGWQQMPIAHWLRHLKDAQLDQSHNIRQTPNYAFHMLTVLSALWHTLLDDSHSEVLKILEDVACIPTTSSGRPYMHRPKEAYFRESDVFRGLPVVRQELLVDPRTVNVLEYLGVQKRCDISTFTTKFDNSWGVDGDRWDAMDQDLTKRITKVEDYPVARGGFGEVWRCMYSTDQGPIKVAVKSLLMYASDQLSEEIEKKTKRIRREFKTCARLKHANILAVYGYTYGFGRFMAIVSPWAENGNLTTYLEKENAALTLVRRFDILRDIAAGLQYLHANKVIHGDLNGPNVLIRGDGTACLADFGLSLLYSEVVSISQASWTSTFHGNLRWLAPELLGRSGNELPVRPTKFSDIYSFGGIMLQVLTSKVPYYYLNEPAVILCIHTGEKPDRSYYPTFSDEYWCFIEECWSAATQDRPSAERVVEVINELFVKVEQLHTWSAEKVVRHLESDSNTNDRLEDIQAQAIFPCDKGGKHCTTGLRLPQNPHRDNDIRELNLPILDWPNTIDTDDGQLSTVPGSLRHPPLKKIIEIAGSPDLTTRHAAFTYFSNKFDELYEAEYDPSKYEGMPFIPAIKDGTDCVGAHEDVYSDPSWAMMGFRKVHPSVDRKITGKLRMREAPSAKQVIEILEERPPMDSDTAAKWFAFLATKQVLSPGDLQQVAEIPIVPIEEFASHDDSVERVVRMVPPRECFLGGNQYPDDHLYRRIFTFVDFGERANRFLRACGVKAMPDFSDIVNILIKDPYGFLKKTNTNAEDGPEKYLAELRSVAIGYDSLSEGDKRRMREAPIFVAYHVSRAVDIDQPPTPTLKHEFQLVRASDILIADDMENCRIFGHFVWLAPQDELLEKFYESVGSGYLSNRIKYNVKPSRESNWHLCDDVRNTIVEKLPIFLNNFDKRRLKNPSIHLYLEYESRFIVRGCKYLKVEKRLDSNYCISPEHREDNFESVVSAEITTEENSPVTLWLKKTDHVDMYDIAVALCRLLFKTHKKHDVLSLMIILETDKEVLRRRGYDVGRIGEVHRTAVLEARRKEKERKEEAPKRRSGQSNDDQYGRFRFRFFDFPRSKSKGSKTASIINVVEITKSINEVF